jgi:hypothetical protein
MRICVCLMLIKKLHPSINDFEYIKNLGVYEPSIHRYSGAA